MNPVFYQSILRISLVAVNAVASIHALATDIAFLPTVTPKSAVVQLADVAEIAGRDRQIVERLSATPLIPAPSSGSRFLRMREVQDLLAAHGEDIAALNFRGATLIEVRPAETAAPEAAEPKAHTGSRRQATLTGNVIQLVGEEKQASKLKLSAAQNEEVHRNLRDLIVEYVEHMSGRKATWDASFSVAPDDALAIATAGLPLQCSGGHAPWTGNQRFVVSFATTSGNSRYTIFAQISATRKVVVAARDIERGEMLTASAFELREVAELPAASVRRMPVESVDSLVGMEAMKAIRAGDVIFNDDGRPRLLVKRGDEISVVASGGGLRVRTIAKARQDGARGELIVVEAPGSKESYEAVVTGVREAAVFAGADSPTKSRVAEQSSRCPLQ